jgi:hypothetical protein
VVGILEAEAWSGDGFGVGVVARDGTGVGARLGGKGSGIGVVAREGLGVGVALEGGDVGALPHEPTPKAMSRLRRGSTTAGVR